MAADGIDNLVDTTGMLEPGGWGALIPQILTDQLNLSQPWGVGWGVRLCRPHHYLPRELSDLPSVLYHGEEKGDEALACHFP